MVRSVNKKTLMVIIVVIVVVILISATFGTYTNPFNKEEGKGRIVQWTYLPPTSL